MHLQSIILICCSSGMCPSVCSISAGVLSEPAQPTRLDDDDLVRRRPDCSYLQYPPLMGCHDSIFALQRCHRQQVSSPASPGPHLSARQGSPTEPDVSVFVHTRFLSLMETFLLLCEHR